MNRTYPLAAASLLTALSVFALAQSPAAISAGAAPSGGVLLKYKYAPGQTLHYQLTEDIKTATMMGMGSMPMTTHASSEFTQTVQSIDPKTGNATIRVQTAAPKMTMTINGKTTPMPMGGAGAFTMTEVMSPGGKPVSVTMQGASGAQTALPSGGMGSSLFPGSGPGQYSAFPNHAVRVGDIWRNTISLGATGSQMLLKQSLVGLNTSGGRTVANIASRYSMNMNMAPNVGMSSGFKVTGLATGTGHTMFDVNAGAMNSSTMMMVMNMKTKMPANLAKMAPGMGAINTHMVMNMRIQRIGS